jgi:S-methylmethionine-dependent homocysteine/selenocysteine methylase
MTLAKEALQETNKAGTVPIAGSISTMNHPFRPDLSPDAEECSDHHRECSELLADAGADFIFLEGMNNITEMTEAVRGAKGTGLPVWVSLIPDTAGNLLSGESLNEAAAIARKESTDAVLLSGAMAAASFNDSPLKRLPAVSGIRLTQTGSPVPFAPLTASVISVMLFIPSRKMKSAPASAKSSEHSR